MPATNFHRPTRKPHYECGVCGAGFDHKWFVSDSDGNFCVACWDRATDLALESGVAPLRVIDAMLVEGRRAREARRAERRANAR